MLLHSGIGEDAQPSMITVAPMLSASFVIDKGRCARLGFLGGP